MITKDTLIADVLKEVPESAALFLDMGMHCLGCPSARAESIAEACEVHGKNPEKLVDKINSLIRDK